MSKRRTKEAIVMYNSAYAKLCGNDHKLAGGISYTTAIGHFRERGWIDRDLLYTKANPTSSGERDKKFGKILTLLGSSDPALRLEALGIRK